MNTDLLVTAVSTAAWTMPFVMGFVKLWGSFGVSGKWQLLSSLLTGVVITGFMSYVQVNPVTLIDWTTVAFSGIASGLGAAGVFEVVKEASAKGQLKS